MDLGLCWTDADGRIRRANGAFAEQIGQIDADAVSGELISEIFARYSQTTEIDQIESALDQGNDLSLEMALSQGEGGASLRVEFLFAPLQQGRGETTQWLGITRKIHSKKEPQKRSLSSETNHDFVLDNVTTGIAVVRPDLKVKFANRAARRLTGLTSDELNGENLKLDPRWYFVTLDGSTLPVEEYPIVNALKSKVAVRDKVLGSKRLDDGELTWFSCSAIPFIGDDGEVVEVVVSFSDISDVIEANRREHIHERRFDIVAETHDMALVEWDLETKEFWENDKFRKIFRREAPSLFGVDEPQAQNEKNLKREDGAVGLFDYAISADRERVRESLIAAIENGDEAWSAEPRMRRSDGKIITVQIKAAIIRHSNGTPQCVIAKIVDITNQKQEEEKLARARALEALGQLTGGIAHDFNNLLAIILGNAEMLQTENLSDEAAESLELIDSAIASASQLTRRLLSFAGQLPTSSQQVDLSEFLPNVMKLIRAGIPENIAIDFTNHEKMEPVRANANELEQVIVNLVVNARDAMPRGGQITVNCEKLKVDARGRFDDHEELEPGEYVCIAVSDNGDGIPPRLLPRVFDPFFTTKEVGKGTGLGLASVYGFAKQFGGRVSIYSEVGLGTTVNLILPTYRDIQQVNAETSSQSTPRKGQGERILVVEDNPDIRAFVQRVLNASGYQVTPAEDAEAALVELRKGEHFDLLFTDVIMPGPMNGRTLASCAQEIHREIGVLYTSGYPAAAFNHMGLDGIDDLPLLRKPYRIEELLDKVANIIAA